MRVGITVSHDLPAFADSRGRAIRAGAMRGATRFSVRAKLAFRDDVRRGGLGDRLANTWRNDVYPRGGRQSWHPALVVWSKAPEIITAHTDGVTIKHKEGLYLAIPTENCPNKGKKKATPVEVEAIFDQDLTVIKSKTNPNTRLAFVNVVKGKSGKWRKATKRRVKGGAEKKFVLMFVLVRQVTLRKRLNWPQLANSLGPAFTQTIAEEVARELGA